ncbi:hypothetical protein EVAR_68790_1 [Eumeta japonica]|uniref:Uncharacterized protein n=1 Tax=Eumeta variegata TaxID=151549 RepID=A0A4C1Z886_EUMVA|nr:hypothetical protein EVAR_68790_1 [Eumeta japonica]
MVHAINHLFARPAGQVRRLLQGHRPFEMLDVECRLESKVNIRVLRPHLWYCWDKGDNSITDTNTKFNAIRYVDIKDADARCGTKGNATKKKEKRLISSVNSHGSEQFPNLEVEWCELGFHYHALQSFCYLKRIAFTAPAARYSHKLFPSIERSGQKALMPAKYRSGIDKDPCRQCGDNV